MTPETQEGPESLVREIKRNTHGKITAEEKIRIVLEGFKGEESIADIFRREGIAPVCITNGTRGSWRQVSGG